MREIKFRAWDKSEEEMLDNEAIFGNELCVQTGHQDEDFIFMQYTGLRDKNGMGLTEVYEGDIISIDGTLKGSIYENNKEPTDIIIPQLGTKAWNDAYKEAVARGYDYSE